MDMSDFQYSSSPVSNPPGRIAMMMMLTALLMIMMDVFNDDDIDDIK